MKSFGSLWLLGSTHLARLAQDSRGLLYITPEGEMLIADEDADAPSRARYVCRVGPGVDPLYVAARIAHEVRFLPTA